MMGESWKNPWKLTTIGIVLVMASVAVTGLVVASWTGSGSDKEVAIAGLDRTATRGSSAPAVRALPTQSAMNSCNQTAAAQAGQREKTRDTVIAGAIGAGAGAAVGAAGGAVVDGGSGAGKGAIIGGLVGAGGSTLYGLNENRKRDETYRNSYAACMRGRGYAA